MKKALIIFLTVLLLAMPISSIVLAAPGETSPDALEALAGARKATTKYHDVNEALADGYVPASPCVEVPGLGVMGIHYVNFALLFDPAVDEATPEVLLYVPTKSGPRLVGVEYVAVFAGQPAPELFGRPMDGPMPGHGPDEPPHFDLHVWLWEGNPNGIFEAFNPNLSCQ